MAGLESSNGWSGLPNSFTTRNVACVGVCWMRVLKSEFFEHYYPETFPISDFASGIVSSNAAKEKNGTCTPCVEGLSCPTGSTVDMLTTAESMVQTKLVEGPKRVFKIHENPKYSPPTPSYASIHFVPRSSSVGRRKEIVLYSSFGQQSHGHLAHFLPSFVSDKAPSMIWWSIVMFVFRGVVDFLVRNKNSRFQRVIYQKNKPCARIQQPSRGSSHYLPMSAWTLSRLGKHMAKRNKNSMDLGSSHGAISWVFCRQTAVNLPYRSSRRCRTVLLHHTAPLIEKLKHDIVLSINEWTNVSLPFTFCTITAC